MLDLNHLSRISYEISKKRENNGAFKENTTVSLIKHTATEVIEAMESLTILRESAIDDTYNQKIKFADELADIIICVLIIAGKENINIEKAILDCMEKNKKRAECVGDKL